MDHGRPGVVTERPIEITSRGGAKSYIVTAFGIQLDLSGNQRTLLGTLKIVPFTHFNGIAITLTVRKRLQI